MTLSQYLSLTASLAVAIFTPPANAGQSRRCAPLDVRVMSYNIRLDIASDGANRWLNRRNELIGQIEILRPDIFGLQEVVPSQRRDIAAALTEYELVGVARDDGRDSGEYSPLGISRSAFQVQDSGTFWLSPTPDRPSLGWDAGYNRFVTWARLRHRSTGTRLLVLNTHWDHRGRVARRESAALIGRWIDQHRKSNERLLLLGDFNAPLPETSMTLLTNRGLYDSRLASEKPPLGSETTFNNFQPLPPRSQAIDHILAGKEWSVRRHATIAQHVDGRVISDHFPGLADLATTPRRCKR
jgi:endonuclease/exonuclease/phosphatase family metal-dependent hydrolase